MTIEELRSNPDLTSQWAQVLKLEITQLVMNTLLQNGPAFTGLPPFGLTPTDSSIRHGHVLGFSEYHQRLEEAALPWKTPQHLESTYTAPDDTEE